MSANANTQASIVLQNRESFLYLKANGQWTANVAEATKFAHSADASSFARKARITALDIVMTFGDPKYDVRLSACS